MRSDDIAIRVQELGKKFLVPQKHEQDFSRAPSWRERLKEFFPSLLGADESDFFWALRDVSFEVRRGEVMGIVGENGSGKSTLLKILSGITPPTEGVAEIHGRVGSLLEVGTGFHPDMTGRENIFFNGALLGVPTSEIRAKLHTIIEFSGIGDFIDVPVKRYSSGMYVRLAYSVAALLDSEIMILDEVLAVGDEHFRSKTQDHMRQATNAGKTILFVSHNAKTVAQICDRGIILDRGRMVFEGLAREVIAEYQSRQYFVIEQGLPNDGSEESQAVTFEDALETDPAGTTSTGEDRTEKDGEGEEANPDVRTSTNLSGEGNSSKNIARPVRRHFQPHSYANISNAGRLRQSGVGEPTGVLKWISVHGLDGERCARFRTFDGMRVRIGFAGLADPARAYFSVLVHNSDQDRLLTAHSTHIGRHLTVRESGTVECVVPSLLLGDGFYSVMIDSGVYDFVLERMVTQDCVPRATYIRVSVDGRIPGTGHDEYRGYAMLSQWKVIGTTPEGENPPPDIRGCPSAAENQPPMIASSQTG